MIRGLFLNVFNQGIAASYLIIAVIFARALLKKAPKSVYCVLWLLVGIRLILPFSFVSAFSLIPSGAEVRGNITEFMGHDTTDTGDRTALSAAPSNGAGYIDEEMIRAIGNNNSSPESGNRPFIYFSIAAVIWFVGVGIMLLYLAISWVRISRKVRFAIPAEQGGIKYYQCEEIASPFLFGFLKTRIYAPAGLGAEELSYVLKHETVHRQRKDYLIKPIGYVILAVYWFNPFVWAAYILLCRDIELACDERVIKELGGEHKKEYALALLSCSVNHRAIAACPVAFGETGVKNRVKNVLNYKKPTFWIIALTVAVIVVVMVCFMTEKVETDIVQNDSGAHFVMVNPANSQGTKKSPVVSRPQPDDILDEETEQLTERIAELEAAIKEYQEEIAMQEGIAVHQREQLEQQIAVLEAEKKAIYEQINVQNTNETEADYNAYVKQWAEAFCDRDGKTIVALTDERLQSELISWGVNDNNEPYAAFGWSSPWPWGSEGEPKNYRILSVTDKGAVILYYAWVSDPHVTVWREELSYTMQQGVFRVTAQNIQFLEGICVAEEFYNAYPDGVIDDTMMDYYAYNQAGEALNENSKDPSMVSSAYAGLDKPDTAAIRLLNILQNENKVTADVEFLNEEQTEAVVTFTFLENASTAKVRMIKPYGEDSIWLPQTYR